MKNSSENFSELFFVAAVAGLLAQVCTCAFFNILLSRQSSVRRGGGVFIFQSLTTLSKPVND